MATILAKVSYDGTNYYGWQRQEGYRTIQAHIEDLLANILNEKIDIYAAGRTDAGVHALGQTFSFRTSKKDTDLDHLKYALNRLLPPDICIENMEYVEDNFHARYYSKGKRYRYIVSNGKKDALNANRMYFVHQKLDYDLMKKAAEIFKGEHLFINFTTKEEDTKDYVRNIYEFDIKKEGDIFTFEISGDGFMRYMVRMMVGTIIKVGLGQLSLDELKTLLEKKNPNGGTVKAPSNGLYLIEVFY